MLEIYFETYGCSANKNSSEIMKGIVKSAGLNLIENPERADFVVINSCIVKEPTEAKIKKRINDFLKKDKKVILAGCMPRLSEKKFAHVNNLFLIDTSQVKNIVNLIKDIQEGNYTSEKYLKKRNEVKLNSPKISEERIIGITQISEGCLGECKYCITKVAKGKLFSYPLEEIVKNVQRDVDSGCKEIWLTSQDCASYGNEDGKYLFPELLRNIIEIKGDFFIRIGMMNPNNVLKILPELIELYKNTKMFKFLHIPIQSGSDKVLKEMGRNYKIADVMKIVKEFKKNFPDGVIATDIIVGYPGETERDFKETYDLIQEIKPEILNSSKFWPRSGTPAARLKQVDRSIVIKRVSKLMKLHLDICNENQLRWKYLETDVLIDQKGFPGTFLARDKNYRLFGVQTTNKNLLGKVVKVKVKKVLPHYLVSEVKT
ncbi:tRNA-2-methylthio-N(6)-dimethylallyladenosine synthase [uncultured archaeon]|nr:tRNA-2-methylthio-N(6)-dimethylallyladenosine synthase [uncultured archaeon]